MRSYVIVTGLTFFALAATHGIRLAVEGVGQLANPIFIIATLASLAMTIWAALLLKRGSQPLQ